MEFKKTGAPQGNVCTNYIGIPFSAGTQEKQKNNTQ